MALISLTDIKTNMEKEANMDKEIYVVCGVRDNLYNSKWDLVWEILDDADEEGITYKKMTSEEYAKQENPDGYIFIDMEPLQKKLPFIHLCALEDDDDKVVEKIQELAGYLFGEWTPPVEEVMETPTKIEEPKHSTINIKDIGYEITEEEVEQMVIRQFVVNIDGKDVVLSKKDLITLSKVCHIVDKMGYKVKQVVV